MSNVRFYWLIFMTVIVVPAFLLASSAEGVTFEELLFATRNMLSFEFVPNFVTFIVSYPVSILAKMLPGTSTLIPVFGDIIWQGVGIASVLIIFSNVAPPLNRDADTRIYVIRFSSFVTFLVIYWICAEILFGFFRDPLADTYTGNVYVVTQKNGMKYTKPLRVNLKLDIVDAGHIYDRRPGVNNDVVRMEFTGPDVALLTKYGVPAQMLNSDGRKIPFEEPVCSVTTVKTEQRGPLFGSTEYRGGYTNYAVTFHLSFGTPLPGKMDCGKIHLGVLNFNHLQFAMDELNPNAYIYTDMKRDSHISLFQRLIMKYRFDRNKPETGFGS